MLDVESEAGPGRLGGDQGIDHDEAALALEDRHVRDVESTDLIDALADLEEPVVQVEARLPPQAGIHRRRRLGMLEESVVAETPHDATLRVLDLDLRQAGHEATPGVVEILRVRERQRVEHRAIQGAGDRGGVLRSVGGRGHRVIRAPVACAKL